MVAGERSGSCGAGRALGMPPKRDPIVSTGSPQHPCEPRRRHHGEEQARPARPPEPHQPDDGKGHPADQDGRGTERSLDLPETLDLVHHLARQFTLEAEEVLDLADGNDDADAAGEAEDHRARNILDVGAEPEQRSCDQHEPGEEGRCHQPGHAMRMDDVSDDDDERRRRPPDLIAAAAEGRDEEARDNRSDKAAVGRCPGADSDRHGKRQRKNCDGKPRE